jgi:hypothetical protein
MKLSSLAFRPASDIHAHAINYRCPCEAKLAFEAMGQSQQALHHPIRAVRHLQLKLRFTYAGGDCCSSPTQRAKLSNRTSVPE